jgi:heptosyltransferase III
LKQQINLYRRKLTRYFTKEMGKNCYITKELDKNLIRKVLIIRPNHRLGNILLITPLVEEVLRHFPDAKIDFFVKGKVTEIIFQNHPNVDEVFFLPKNHFKELFIYISSWFKLISKKKYDLIVNANHSSSSGQLATKWAKANYKFFGIETLPQFEKLEDYHHFAKFPVYNFRAYLLKSYPNLVFNEIAALTLHLTEKDVENGKTVLHKITQNEKPNIAFFTFATGEKCYSVEFWEEFYSKLQTRFGETHNLIEVLPVENVSQINFKSKNYYSKDLIEIASVLSHTKVFIGADSGMMHLAATSTTTLGLFKNNSLEKYQPFGNGSRGIDTNKMNIDECLDLVQNLIKE